MRYDTLLIDADGTLFDFDRAEAESLRRMLAQFGLPYDEIWVSTYHKINDGLWKALERGEVTKTALRQLRFRNLLETFGYTADVPAMADCYTDNLSCCSFLLPGVPEACARLSEKYRLYIVTNGIKEVQTRRFASSLLVSYIRKCYISDEIGFEKPDKRFFDYVMADIPGFSPEKALVIGDSLTSDMLGANRAGLDCCWYNPTGKNCPENIRVSFQVQTMTQLCDLLLEGEEET